MDKFLGLLISIHAIRPTAVWEAQSLLESCVGQVQSFVSYLIVIPL